MIERGLKIYHVNTCSILNKISLIQTLYDDVDILCCSETWLDNRVSDNLIKMPGKNIFRSDRHNTVTDYSKRVFGGGVCIYVGRLFKSFSEKVSKFSKITPDYETVTVTITKPNNRKMLFVCLYKPPTGKIENCVKFLTEITTDPDFSKYEIWILGDFNIDIMKRDDAKVIILQEFVKKNLGFFSKSILSLDLIKVGEAV